MKVNTEIQCRPVYKKFIKFVECNKNKKIGIHTQGKKLISVKSR